MFIHNKYKGWRVSTLSPGGDATCSYILNTKIGESPQSILAGTQHVHTYEYILNTKVGGLLHSLLAEDGNFRPSVIGAWLKGFREAVTPWVYVHTSVVSG